MAKDHRTTIADRARDELMSHVMRCKVLDASMGDRETWMVDTLEYMQERYPDLTKLQMLQLGQLGRQFIQPVIPHGSGNTAVNRPEPTVVTEDGETIPESEADTPVGDAELQPA